MTTTEKQRLIEEIVAELEDCIRRLVALIPSKQAEEPVAPT
jgi:hypothetical protein